MRMQRELMSLLKRELVVEILIDNTEVVRLGKGQLVAVRQLKLVVVVALHIQRSRVRLVALPQGQLPAAMVAMVVVVFVPENQLVVSVMVPQTQVMVVRLAKHKFMVVLVGLAQD
jgi:hypothetical protein